MKNIKEIVTEQLQQLHRLVHRSSCQGREKVYTPYRGQGRILKLLEMKSDITQRELAYLLDMSKQSLAEILRKLEKDDLITRRPSETDKRLLRIELTEEGEKMAHRVKKKHHTIPLELDALNEDELKVFSGYLERIMLQTEAVISLKGSKASVNEEERDVSC